MRPDKDILKAPVGDQPELIPADPEMRRSRSFPVKLVSHAKRQGRSVVVDSQAAERMSLGACNAETGQSLHGDVRVTPALADKVAIGDVIRHNGRPYRVVQVCRKSCAPKGWVRMDPMRMASDTIASFAPGGAPIPMPVYSVRCPHQAVIDPRATTTADIAPTVGVVYGENKKVMSYDRHLSMRQKQVVDLFARSQAAHDKGNIGVASTLANLAVRAHNMTDDQWLEERKANAAR